MADLGNIHAKYGFVVQALALWEKAYDNSSQIEDQQKMALKILTGSYICQNRYMLNRFCEKLSQQETTNQKFTQTVAVFNILSKLIAEKPLDAARAFQNCPITLNVDQNTDLLEYVTTEELAIYTILTCLAQMPRNEIKSLLANSNILSLLDTTEYSDIFENFLNGRFESLQVQISKLRLKLESDVFFSGEDIFN